MKSLADIDKNFKVETKIEREGLKFFDAEDKPFRIYGVFREGDRFRRLPEEVAKGANEGVLYLHSNTAGGRVRFITDSPFVAINVTLDKAEPMDHFAFTGIAGLDLYVKEAEGERYKKTFRPPTYGADSFEGIFDFGEKKTREITINMPLYSDVKKLYIGLLESARVNPPSEYKISKPMVFYGSSITQGGCASRPGMSYESIISRELDADFINLGFSGSARGEQIITDYIKELDMSLFVLDYDHNAPTKEHLEKTHSKMFSCIRKANPTLPILMMSRPQFFPDDDEKARIKIIRKTFDDAAKAGDKNVYFIDGSTLMSDEIKADGTVDNCHPTDLGFFSMAKRMLPVIRDILK